jgi:hypothetical protein
MRACRYCALGDCHRIKSDPLSFPLCWFVQECKRTPRWHSLASNASTAFNSQHVHRYPHRLAIKPDRFNTGGFPRFPHLRDFWHAEAHSAYTRCLRFVSTAKKARRLRYPHRQFHNYTALSWRGIGPAPSVDGEKHALSLS